MSTVLITGAGGFIGRAVGLHFLQRGWRVVGTGPTLADGFPGHEFHRLLLPHPLLDQLLKHVRPAVIVHAAGRASVPASFIDPERDFRSSVDALFQVLDGTRRLCPRARVVFPSSAAVYGDPRAVPVRETHETNPVSPYGFHKKLCEDLCTEHHRCFSIETTVLRIFSAYGPGLRRQVVWDVYEKAVSEGEILLQGTGAESRDFIHVTDVAAALYLSATAARSAGETFNVASGIETPIAELAAAVVSRSHPSRTIRFSGTLPPGTPTRWRADIGKLHGIGFQPAHDLQSGLDDTVAGYQHEDATRWLRKSA